MRVSPSSSRLIVRSGSGAPAPIRDEETRRSTLPIGPPAGHTSGGSAAKRQECRRVTARIAGKRNTNFYCSGLEPLVRNSGGPPPYSRSLRRCEVIGAAISTRLLRRVPFEVETDFGDRFRADGRGD